MLMKESVTGLIAVSVQATSCSALQLFLLEAQSPLVTTTEPEAGEAVSTQEEKKDADEIVSGLVTQYLHRSTHISVILF